MHPGEYSAPFAPLPPPPSAGVERRLDSAASTTTIYGRESDMYQEIIDELSENRLSSVLMYTRTQNSKIAIFDQTFNFQY